MKYGSRRISACFFFLYAAGKLEFIAQIKPSPRGRGTAALAVVDEGRFLNSKVFYGIYRCFPSSVTAFAVPPSPEGKARALPRQYNRTTNFNLSNFIRRVKETTGRARPEDVIRPAQSVTHCLWGHPHKLKFEWREGLDKAGSGGIIRTQSQRSCLRGAGRFRLRLSGTRSDP